MDESKNTARMAPLAFRMGIIGLAGLGLGGCTIYDNGYGHSGVSVGVGYSDGSYDPYYDDYYYGWYEDYYYPGSGYYVYDRRGYRHRWSDRHRHYWQQRRSGVRQMAENWAGYSRGGDGYYRDQRRHSRRVDRREDRHDGRRDGRRGRDVGQAREEREEGFGNEAVRRAAEAASRETRRPRSAERSGSRPVAPAETATGNRRVRTAPAPATAAQPAPPQRVAAPESRRQRAAQENREQRRTSSKRRVSPRTKGRAPDPLDD